MIKPALYKTVAAAAAVAAMFAAAPAHAFVYGVSHLDLRNLALVTTGATTTVNAFTFNLNNTSELFGVSANSSATCNSAGVPACSGVSPVLNATVVNAPGSTTLRPENNFSLIGTGPAGSYSNADSVINSAAVVQGVLTSTQQIAESLLNSNGTASAGARVNSNTSFVYSMVIGAGATLAFSFEADADQMSQISDGPGTYLAGTAMSSVFTLNRNGGGSVTWRPSGTAANNECSVASFVGVTCTETADGEDLNTLTSTGSNPGIDQNSTFNAAADFSAFGINISGLPQGNYTLVLEANTTTSLIRGAQVPEPGSIALVGLALAGLGVTTARRAKRTA